MNGRKQVMWPETDVGNELPLIVFDVTYIGLDELSKLMCSDNQLHPSISKRQILIERERLPKGFN